jgi:hypothetical protein
MRVQLSNRDYEQLSAYIDGQLTPAEAGKLEERLRSHSDLQAVLDEISRTKALLRSAPRRRAPRNFTLSPAMVGAQRLKRSGSGWNLFTILSFASAVATLALVATIVFQLLPTQKMMETAALQQPQADQVADIVQRTMTAMGGKAVQATAPAGAPAPLQSGQTGGAMGDQGATPAAEKQAEPPTEQPRAIVQPTATMESLAAMPAAEAVATPEEVAADSASQANPPIISWGTNVSPTGMGGYGGAGGGGQGPSTGSLLGPPAAAGAETILGKGGGGAETTYGQNIVIPQESINPQDEAGLSQPEVPAPEEAAPAQANPAIIGTGPILGVPSQGEGGQIVDRKAILGKPEAVEQGIREAAPPSQPAEEANRSGEQTPGPGVQTILGLPVIVIGQAVLALIAIAAGVAAFLTRRRAR